MPKYKLIVDLDSIREEGEHLESIFEKGIEADDEHEAELIVDAKVKELMYGGPYYAIVDDEDDDNVINTSITYPDARDQHLIKPNLKKMTGGK